MSITAQLNHAPASAAPGVLAKRLLVGAICFAGVIAGIVCINVREAAQHPDHKLSFGHDLLPSYVAGTFVREGHPREMYDIDAVHRQEAIVIRSADLAIDKQGGPWLNPPFFAWLFAPLSALSYRQASAVFLVLNLSLLAASSFLLARQLPVRDWRLVLVPLILCTSMPFWQALGHQQNTFISLFLLSLTVTFWQRARPLLAGCVAGLLFFKPQLAVVVSLVLIATMGRRAFAGIAVTGASLLLVTLLTLPGTLGDFLTKLSPIVRVLQSDPAYNWGRQDTFQSFWRLLLNGHIAEPTPLVPKLLTWASSAIVAMVLFRQTRGVVRAGNATDNLPRLRRLIAATIISMPLLMPYYMDYDLLLLAVPAALFAGEWLARVGNPCYVMPRAQALLPTSLHSPGWSAEEPSIRLGMTARLLRLFNGPYIAACTHVGWVYSPTDLSPRSVACNQAAGRVDPTDRWQLALWIALFFATQIGPGLAGQTRFNIAVPLLGILCGITLARCSGSVASHSGQASQSVSRSGKLLAA
jgi:hypothetical protein